MSLLKVEARPTHWLVVSLLALRSRSLQPARPLAHPRHAPSSLIGPPSAVEDFVLGAAFVALCLENLSAECRQERLPMKA